MSGDGNTVTVHGKNAVTAHTFNRNACTVTVFLSPYFCHRISVTAFLSPRFYHRISVTTFPSPYFLKHF